LAVDSLKRARQLVREGERSEELQFLLARAQVNALLAVEQRLQPLGESLRRDSSGAEAPRENVKARDYQFELNGEDEVPEEVRRFVELTNDRDVGAAFDLESPSSTLLVAFGGLPGHIGMPPFEFFNISQDLSVKKAYLRDLDRAWYHAGVRGLGDNPQQVTEKLREAIARADASKVVFAGNSAGGWAALLFGALVDVDLVLAFSPQTTLQEKELRAANDTRWDRALIRARNLNLLSDEPLDLRPVLESNPPSRDGRRVVHFDSAFDLDAFHAERLANLPGVELDGHPERLKGGHGLIRGLRRDGRLGEMLRDAVAERPAAD
jgi:hypothetical protein